jgi:hypothetical protein
MLRATLDDLDAAIIASWHAHEAADARHRRQQPNEWCAEPHNRMPAIIAPRKPGSARSRPTQLKALLAPYPSDEMMCWPARAAPASETLTEPARSIAVAWMVSRRRSGGATEGPGTRECSGARQRSGGATNGRGTDGSNPLPSSSESSANPLFSKSVAQFTRKA